MAPQGLPGGTQKSLKSYFGGVLCRFAILGVPGVPPGRLKEEFGPIFKVVSKVIGWLPTKTWFLQAIPKNAQNLRYFWIVSVVIRRLPVKPWFPQAIPGNAQN